MIHKADPQSRMVAIAIFTHVVCASVSICLEPSKNCINCGAGWVDHRKLLSCKSFLSECNFLFSFRLMRDTAGWSRTVTPLITEDQAACPTWPTLGPIVKAHWVTVTATIRLRSKGPAARIRLPNRIRSGEIRTGPRGSWSSSFVFFCSRNSHRYGCCRQRGWCY